MRRYSFRPSLTIRGREFHGLRGWAGKPLHPPLTDVPVTAYIFGAIGDVLSISLQSGHHAVARQLFLASSWVLVGGAGISLLTAITGWADWKFSSEPGNQARRTINAHAATMIVVALLIVADVLLRFLVYLDASYSRPVLVALSLAGALLVSVGATLGGSLVYDYGFNVETATDSPVWHRSEIDLLPGDKHHAAEPTADGDRTLAG